MDPVLSESRADLHSVEGMTMPKAVVLTNYGPPDVLVWSEVPMPEPGPGQVRIRIKAAGVSPTDPKIRRGELKAVFPLPAGAVLGFEAAGVVDALGPSVSGVQVGDEVASLLAGLGGYGEYAIASSWTPKPLERQVDRRCRPARFGGGRGWRLEAARGRTGRDPPRSWRRGLGRDDRHATRRLAGRKGRRRRVGAGSRSCARSRRLPGKLRRWPGRSGTRAQLIGGRSVRRGQQGRARKMPSP